MSVHKKSLVRGKPARKTTKAVSGKTVGESKTISAKALGGRRIFNHKAAKTR
ncbi:MAG TPA: hypothetical protein VEI49_06790 [Terriglobales bacterium]|nr:hypothetical protein [Terriglobales bacterium]